MAKKLTFEQLEQRARKALAKATARGKKLEIQLAKLGVARVVKAKKAAERKEKQAKLEPKQQPTQAQQAQKRSAASKKGWETRKLQAAYTGDSFGVDEEGFLPELRKKLTRAEKKNRDTVLRQYTEGKRVFGAYVVCKMEEAEFFIGSVVWTENGEVQYRYTPRELTYSDAMVNATALQTSYKAKHKVVSIIPLKRLKDGEA